VRAGFLAFFLLATYPLLAGERPVSGPQVLLGAPDLAPIAEPYGGNPVRVASDGDEVLLVWIARHSLYAQRLDRDGRLLTSLPMLLAPGDRSLTPIGGTVRVISAGGGYTIFYNRLQDRQWALWSMRVTRELEILDARILSFDGLVDAVHTGEELVVLTTRNVWRLRDDLSVVAMLPQFDGAALAPSPRGTLLISTSKPAITARMIDDSVSVRVASADGVSALRAMWTGTQYLLVWIDCEYGCTTKLLTLDETLAAHSAPVQLERAGCTGCSVGIVKLGADDVIVTWPYSDNTLAQRVRSGVPAETKPLYLGDFVVPFATAQGTLLMINRKLEVRAFVPGSTDSPSALPVLATLRAAVEESIAAVAGTQSEAAIARHRADGTNVVSIVDRDGRTLREVALPNGDEVTLAHDGEDFYALVSDWWDTRFQRVAPGAPAVKLPFRAEQALVWTGSGFFVLQGNYRDVNGQTGRTRFLWLTREGVVEAPPCANWDFPSAARPPVVVPAGDEILVAVGWNLARIRGRCQDGPPEARALPYGWRVAWQNGQWAWVSYSYPEMDLAVAEDLASSPSLHRVDRGVTVFEHNFDIAALAGRWLVAYNDDGALRVSVHDARGPVIGTGTMAERTDGRPFLVPVAGRVLAIHRRQVYESPYLGVHRVIAAPVTLETDFRRRAARP
jgi:hypothetical protein